MFGLVRRLLTRPGGVPPFRYFDGAGWRAVAHADVVRLHAAVWDELHAPGNDWVLDSGFGYAAAIGHVAVVRSVLGIAPFDGTGDRPTGLTVREVLDVFRRLQAHLRAVGVRPRD